MLVIVTISCLRYESAIPVEKDEWLANAVALVAAAACTVLAAFLLVAVTLSQLTTLPMAITLLGTDIWYLPLAALLAGLFSIITFIGIREGHFGYTAIFKITQVVAFAAVAFQFKDIGLIGGYVIGMLVACIGIWRYRTIFALPQWRLIPSAAKKYREFPTMAMPTSLLDTVTLAVPIFVIAGTYSTADVGNYSQVQRLVSAPLLLVGMALSQVFFRHSNEQHHAGKSIAPIMLHTMQLLILTGVGLWLIAALLGDWLFQMILGADWRTDTTFILMALTPVVIRTLVSPIANVFMVCDRISIGTAWQVFHFLMAIIVFPLAAARLIFDEFLIFICIAEAVAYAIYAWLMWRVVRKFDRKALGS